MDLDSKQMDGKPKEVGTLRGKPVYQLRTKGGLFLEVVRGGTGFSILGTGPHRAVARHIAQKHEPEIVWNHLSKSDHVDIKAFELILPKYEELTSALRTFSAE